MIMPPTRLYLVRHAESTWNVEHRWQGQLDPPLSPSGVRQADMTAAALASVPLTAVYSSSLRRAYETARAIGARHRLDVTILEDLREINVGAWQGLTMEEVEAAYPGVLERWRADPTTVVPPDGEPLSGATSRGIRAFRIIVECHRGEAVAVVMHGGISRLSLKALLDGVLPEQLWFPNCAISILDWQDGAASLVCLNDTKHLQELVSAQR